MSNAEPANLEALRDDLRSDSAERAVRAWEHLVLAALDLTPDRAPLSRWAQVYADISHRLTDEADASEALPSSALGSPDHAPADLDAIWGLVYGARTFLLARHLLRQNPAPAGPFVDLGAGWGPFGLAFAVAHPGSDVTLMDLSAPRLARAARLFELAGLPRPQLVAGDTRRQPPRAGVSGAALPYSLGEMVAGTRDEVEAGVGLLSA
ncbi:class I SAM-dependent methyltransferase, partial [Myxococcota bacterium]|nr:class I SAM-dependent methyltransferase [Myxococcota bacterium]